jgi:hypothetical protein
MHSYKDDNDWIFCIVNSGLMRHSKRPELYVFSTYVLLLSYDSTTET